MTDSFDIVTDCPHCKQREFRKALLRDGRIMKAVQEVRAISDSNTGFMIGGPAVAVLFKYCDSCGFMAPFLEYIAAARGVK